MRLIASARSGAIVKTLILDDFLARGIESVIINSFMGCVGMGSYLDSKTTLKIEQLSDGGDLFAIYKDHICSNYPLSRYPNNLKFFDFNLEKLSTASFCTKYIFNKN